MRRTLIVLALSLCILGCDTSTKVNKDNGTTKYTNNVGQTVESVGVSELPTWLSGHKDDHLVCITNVDQGPHGSTSEYLIVYEERKSR